MIECTAPRETPDIETASSGYASRFEGAAGRYFLNVQATGLTHLLDYPRATRVLELGGGHGQLVRVYQERDFNFTIFGSDPCIKPLLDANTGNDNIAFESGDLLNLPYEDDEFDVVVAVRLISHIEDWPRLVAEMCRVARRAVVIDYPTKTSLNALTPLLFRLKKGIEQNTRTYTSFSRAQLSTCFLKNEFEVARQYKQFFLPMVLHRATKGHRILQIAESCGRSVRLTDFFGSPVLLRADARS